MTGILVVNEFLKSNKFNEIHSWLLEAGRKQNINMMLKTNAELLIDIHKGDFPRLSDFILFWDKDKTSKLFRKIGLSGFQFIKGN